jgi:hypothetical protein
MPPGISSRSSCGALQQAGADSGEHFERPEHVEQFEARVKNHA